MSLRDFLALLEDKPRASAEEIKQLLGGNTKRVGYFNLALYEGKSSDAILVSHPEQAKPEKIRGGVAEYAQLLIELALHSLFLRVLSMMGVNAVGIDTPDHYTQMKSLTPCGNITFQTKAFRVGPTKPLTHRASNGEIIEYPAGEVVGIIGVGAFFVALGDHREIPLFIGQDVRISGIPVTKSDLTGEPSERVFKEIQEAVRFALAENNACLHLLQQSIQNSPGQILPTYADAIRAKAAVILDAPTQTIETILIPGEGIAYVPYGKDEGLFCANDDFTPWRRPS